MGITEASLAMKYLKKGVDQAGKVIDKHRDSNKDGTGYWSGSEGGQKNLKGQSNGDDKGMMVIQVASTKADAPTLKVQYEDGEIEIKKTELEVRKPSRKQKLLNVVGKMLDVGIVIAGLVATAAALSVAPITFLVAAAVIGSVMLVAGVTKGVREIRAYKKEMKEYMKSLSPEQLQQLKDAQKISKKERIKNKFHRKDKSKEGNDQAIRDLLNNPDFQKTLTRQTSQIDIQTGGERLNVKSPNYNKETPGGDDESEIEIDLEDVFAILKPLVEKEPSVDKETLKGEAEAIRNLTFDGQISIADMQEIFDQHGAAIAA